MTRHLTDDQLDVLTRSGISYDISNREQREDLASERTAEQRHVDGCLECHARLLGLERLLRQVRDTPRNIEPPLDLWPAIRASIQKKAERPSVGGSAAAIRPWYWSQLSGDRRRSWLVAAAVLLLVTSASTVSFLLGRRSEFGATDDFSGTTAVATAGRIPIPNGKSTAGRIGAALPDSRDPTEWAISSSVSDTPSVDVDAHAEQELLADLEMRRSTLRPQTSSAIDSSLKVIDQAIAELKAASVRDPANATLRQLLVVSRERKIELLRQTENAS